MPKPTAIILTYALAALMGTGHADPAPTEKPPPAAQLLASAKKQAGKEHKAVMVMFHASWCGWCHRLTDLMEKPQFKTLFTDNYVIVPLDASENDKNKALENPGADKVMADLEAGLSGLPFYVFLDSKGKQLANSNAVPNPNGIMQNIGYPSSPEEIAAFDGLLQKTAPKMDVVAREGLITYLTETSPQRANLQH